MLKEVHWTGQLILESVRIGITDSLDVRLGPGEHKFFTNNFYVPNIWLKTKA